MVATAVTGVSRQCWEWGFNLHFLPLDSIDTVKSALLAESFDCD